MDFFLTPAAPDAAEVSEVTVLILLTALKSDSPVGEAFTASSSGSSAVSCFGWFWISASDSVTKSGRMLDMAEQAEQQQ